MLEFSGSCFGWRGDRIALCCVGWYWFRYRSYGTCGWTLHLYSALQGNSRRYNFDVIFSAGSFPIREIFSPSSATLWIAYLSTRKNVGPVFDLSIFAQIVTRGTSGSGRHACSGPPILVKRGPKREPMLWVCEDGTGVCACVR